MTTPRTAAGRALLLGYMQEVAGRRELERTPGTDDSAFFESVERGITDAILAIEADAMPTEAEMAAALAARCVNEPGCGGKYGHQSEVRAILATPSGKAILDRLARAEAAVEALLPYAMTHRARCAAPLRGDHRHCDCGLREVLVDARGVLAARGG